jgi:hypothetical protein
MRHCSNQSIDMSTSPTASASLAGWARCAILFVIILHAGCSKHEESLLVSTGADATTQEFFDALLHRDWRKAYSMLDSNSKAWCSEQRFAELGVSYMTEFGFDPATVNVSVSESGDHASAIALFHGPSSSTNSHFKDGTELRRNGGKWFVVLRTNFGKATAKPGSRHG